MESIQTNENELLDPSRPDASPANPCRWQNATQTKPWCIQRKKQMQAIPLERFKVLGVLVVLNHAGNNRRGRPGT